MGELYSPDVQPIDEIIFLLYKITNARYNYCMNLRHIISIAVVLSVILSALSVVIPIYAEDEEQKIQSEIDALKEKLVDIQNLRITKEQDLQVAQEQIEDIKGQMSYIEQEITNRQEMIRKREKEIYSQREVLHSRVGTHYKNLGRQSSSLLNLFTGGDIKNSLQEYFYQKAALNEDKNIIVRAALVIQQIEDQKQLLHEEKEQLVPLKEQIQEQSETIAVQLEESKSEQQQIEQQIVELTTRQQEIIAQKQASLNLPSSIGSGGLFCADDREIDPGFGAGFAFYTFGIPHRVGLNQYGALGRAKAGQNYEEILNSYFNNVRIECRGMPDNKIKVQGYGDVQMEEYMKGIYEMPASWPLEALKAQVVAARSYAIAYTKNGANEICTTQSCQVYKGGNKGGGWEVAVNQTGAEACPDGQGKVLISNDTGEVISAWYASTAGGYTFNSGAIGWSSKPWTKNVRDTTGDVTTFEDLMNTAYDRDSPCFYAAQGSRPEHNKSAWLKPEELADIVNALMLGKRDASTQIHLSQPDKPNPDGTETWDMEKVKSELRSRGGVPMNRAQDVSVSWDPSIGITTGVTITGDTGSESFDANEFKSFFNLRAPGNIQIVGGLFKTERR